MAKAKEQEQTYPRTLLWEEDGEDLGDRRRVSGRFVGLDEAPTRNGLKPILVLEIDGEERSVWVLHGPFQDKLTEELERRSAAAQPIVRGALRTSFGSPQRRIVKSA